jgi:prepilin signal peptidase PulO-like enzyme (type II secretory pathway)
MAAHRTPFVSAVFGLLVAAEAVTFLLFAAAHLGRPLALGPLRLEEPNIPPATIVEVISGLALLGAAYSLLAGSFLRWRTALRAHVLALAGVLLGVGALALGLGPRTAANDAYHRGMLVLLVAGLVLSLAARWRESRRRSPRFRRATA